MNIKKQIATIKKLIQEIEQENTDISVLCYGHDGNGWDDLTEKEQANIEKWDDQITKKLDKIIKILSKGVIKK